MCIRDSDVGTHGTAQFAALGLCHLVVLRLPECQQQGLDAVLLLHVEEDVYKRQVRGCNKKPLRQELQSGILIQTGSV